LFFSLSLFFLVGATGATYPVLTYYPTAACTTAFGVIVGKSTDPCTANSTCQLVAGATSTYYTVECQQDVIGQQVASQKLTVPYGGLQGYTDQNCAANSEDGSVWQTAVAGGQCLAYGGAAATKSQQVLPVSNSNQLTFNFFSDLACGTTSSAPFTSPTTACGAGSGSPRGRVFAITSAAASTSVASVALVLLLLLISI
jgi:hypothetical protein